MSNCIFTEDILRQAVLGDCDKSPLSVDDTKSLLRDVMVTSVKYSGAKPIENMNQLPDMPFGDVWVNLDYQKKFSRIIGISLGLELGFRPDEHRETVDMLDSAIMYSTAQVYIVRDVLYKRHGLPAFRKDMTEAQKAIADGIEAQMREDTLLRQQGKVRCIWTGIITELTPEQKAKQHKVAHAKQKTLNALAVGAITVDEI